MKVSILVLSGFLMTGNAYATDEAEAMVIARKHGCITCHHLDTKVVGPGWNEITSKYAGQTDIVGVLADRVRTGSNGVWGGLPMPPNATISNEEIIMFLRFVLKK